jgi:hypothetical protein
MPNARVVSWGYSTSNGGGDSEASHQEVSEKLALDLWDLRSSTSVSSIRLIIIKTNVYDTDNIASYHLHCT